MTDPAYQDNVVTTVIREALSRPGWNQARLAKNLGIRPQTVNKWFKGENVPPVQRWGAIESALELPAGTFVERLASTERPISADTVERVRYIGPSGQKALGDDLRQLRRTVEDLLRRVEHLEGTPVDDDPSLRILLPAAANRRNRTAAPAKGLREKAGEIAERSGSKGKPVR